MRHFIRLADFSPTELQSLIDRAIELKSMPSSEGLAYQPCEGQILAILMQQPSTRTRVSLEAGMAQLGGKTIFMAAQDTQMDRGESPEYTARVISGMVDILALRTNSQSTMLEFANHSSVPVINAMTPQSHPCQILADMQTWQELRGNISGRKVAFVGDGHNMCYAYMEAASLFDFNLHYYCPPGYGPDATITSLKNDHVQPGKNLIDTVTDADLVVTDVWSSMGQEQNRKERHKAFTHTQITPQLMDIAKQDALFMHCLPLHEGEEVSAEMSTDARSVIWQEANNRLHSQKAILEFLLHPQR